MQSPDDPYRPPDSDLGHEGMAREPLRTHGVATLFGAALGAPAGAFFGLYVAFEFYAQDGLARILILTLLGIFALVGIWLSWNRLRSAHDWVASCLIAFSLVTGFSAYMILLMVWLGWLM